MSINPREGGSLESDIETSSDTLGLTELLGFFYHHRKRLLLRCLLLMVICAAIFLGWYVFFGRSVRGTVALTFRGMEKHEYPSGRKFSAEDFRSPAVIGAALAEAGLANDNIAVNNLVAYIYVNPVIPQEVRSRWKRQDETGVIREEFYPSEFDMEIAYRGLSDNQRIRLFDAIIRGYQERVKYEQKSALGFMALPAKVSYESLAREYDYWDIPSMFRMTYETLDKHLKSLVAESLNLQDSTYTIAFRDVLQDLDGWFSTRFLSLEGITYEGLLVKDRDLMMKRIRYQIQDLEILVSQRRKESEDAVQLLEVLERPKSVLAGQLTNREGVPIVDVTALDRLIKNDYVAPVVARISQLQQDVQSMEISKARLERQLALLPRASNVTIQTLPERHRAFVDRVSSELTNIIQKYNRLLDSYLSAAVSSSVYVTRPPAIIRKGYSVPMFLLTLFVLCLLVAPFVVLVEVLWERARSSTN